MSWATFVECYRNSSGFREHVQSSIDHLQQHGQPREETDMDVSELTMQYLETRHELELHTEETVLSKLKEIDAVSKRRRSVPKALEKRAHLMVPEFGADEELGCDDELFSIIVNYF